MRIVFKQIIIRLLSFFGGESQNVKPDGYSFNNLLYFFPDGTENAQCFYRAKNIIITVD